MDVLFFLRRRTKFIRRFYDEAVASFEERKRKIEAEEPPFIPPYSEYSEPPFMEEWAEAKTSVEVLARTCISMLSASMELFLKSLMAQAHARCAGRKKNAFLWGYGDCFERQLQIDWSKCPADMAIIEQVALARNRDQHPDHISTFDVHHAKRYRSKHPTPFFVSEHEKRSLAYDADAQWWLGVSVHISREALLAAIAEVENLADWLDAEIAERTKHPR
jgi:hypothetical protein